MTGVRALRSAGSGPSFLGRGSSSRVRVLVALLVVAQFGIAMAAALEPSIAFSVVLLAAVGVIALVFPTPLLLVVAPACFAYWRIGPAAVDMSLTDAVTAIAAVAALPYVPWRNRELRMVMLALAFYFAVLAVACVASPSPAAFGELGHRVLMAGGPLLVGSALGTLGLVRPALRFFLAACAFISVAAIIETLTHGLRPAFPLGMHKNAVGAHLASGLLIMLAASRRVGLRRWMTAPLAVLLVAGLLASQSRGAALAVAIVAAVYLFRHPDARLARLAPVIFVLCSLLLIYAIASFESSQGNEGLAPSQHDSVTTRIDGYTYAIEHVWKPHIPLGAGPKWFRAADAGAAGPHNIFVSELSESGLLGLFALLVLLGITLRALWMPRTGLSTAGFLVFLERVVDTMLGIFWVAGTGTLPWLTTGLVFGDLQRARNDDWTDHSGEDGNVEDAADALVRPTSGPP